MYDLAVAYRIYPKVSKPSLGLPFDDDKLHQAELCVRSFKRAVASLKVKLWAVMDNCPPEYEAMFRRYFAPEDLILVPLTNAGNFGTFSKQMDILLSQTDAEAVYFAEDDYLYLPFDFSLLLRLLDKGKEVDFISALDHPDDYCLDFHRFPKWIQVFEGTHWRSAASTCLTFLTKKKTLTRFSQIFRSYERDNYDTSLWMSVTKHRLFNVFSPMVYNPDDKFFNLRALVKAWRYGFGQNLLGARARLWVPMPSLALHLDRHHPAPGFDMAAWMLEEDRATADSLLTAQTAAHDAVGISQP